MDKLYTNNRNKIKGLEAKIEIINILKNGRKTAKEIKNALFEKEYNIKRTTLYGCLDNLLQKEVISKERERKNVYFLTPLWLFAFKDNFRLTNKVLQKLELTPEEYTYINLVKTEPSDKFEELIFFILNNAIETEMKIQILGDESEKECCDKLRKNCAFVVGRLLKEIDKMKLTKQQKYLLLFVKKYINPVLSYLPERNEYLKNVKKAKQSENSKIEKFIQDLESGFI